MIELRNSPKGKNVPANPEEKAGYRLEFCDNFEETNLDTTKWLPYYLPQWSSRDQTKARHSLHDGTLQLHIETDQRPWSPEYDGGIRVSSLQTGCFSGELGSASGQLPFKEGLRVREAQPALKLYTPLYGYFETRLKAVALPGYMCAFWMIGFAEKPEQTSEICICEIKGEHISSDSSVIGYGVHPFNDPNIEDEFYEDKVSIDAANFHLYAAEWTPSQVDFYIDNQKIKTIEQSANYPMQFMLNIYELPATLTPESKNAPFPKSMTVDYVRGYKKVGD